MISSGGKWKRTALILGAPLWALGAAVTYIWGGKQGVEEFFNRIENWMKP
jgi:hypothetical protein